MDELRQRLISLSLHRTPPKKNKPSESALPVWVEQAMKGDHPFVLAADSICGGGSQLLSEVVANWIRAKPQVANRPKGYLV